jgi:methylmalonyl-CoA mutase C-terminal domain/subunit
MHELPVKDVEMERKRESRKARVLLGKIGFDGHDRGVKIIAAILREAGHEVIYLGKYLTTETVVQAAVDEDVDVIGLSFLGGAHVVYSREIVERMQQRGLEDVLFLVGGVIPHQDVGELIEIGVDAVFPSNTITQDIVVFLDRQLDPGENG